MTMSAIRGVLAGRGPVAKGDGDGFGKRYGAEAQACVQLLKPTLQAWIMVVGTGLPLIGSGIVFGTSTSLPSTFTLIFSTGGGAGLGSIVVVADIL